MYVVSKILALLIQPSSIALIALGVGLWLTRRQKISQTGRASVLAGFFVLLVCGFVPVGNWLVIPLEQRFAHLAPPEPGLDIAGIIMLGGFEDGWISSGRPGLAVNEAAERLTESVRLAHRFPNSKVVFSGGVGLIFQKGMDATGPVSAYLRDVGIGAERIAFEGKSRNTRENALYSAELLKPRPGGRWVLVTSASHMARAAGAFRKQGFEIIPYPVDYRTRGPDDAFRLFDSMPGGFQRLDMGVKEWASLAYYWLMGWTDTLFPGP